MTVTLSNAFARGGLKIDVGGGSGRAEEGKPMVRIDDTYAIGEKVRKKDPFILHLRFSLNMSRM
jgi:hypothetical protein